jgi:alpha-1,6-mannosyltransferase
MHVADVTMFFGRESGGVKRYLTAKQSWFKHQPKLRHTLLVPGKMRSGQGDNRASGATGANVSIVHLPSLPVPFSNGYRFPLRAERAAEELQLLDPDIIEAGDPYTLAWSALRAGDRLGIPVVGFYHSDLPRMVHLRLGSPGHRIAEAYVGNLYSRFDLVLAPSQAMLRDLRQRGIATAQHQPLGVDVSAFRPADKPLDLRAWLGLAPNTRLLAYVGRFAREKNLPWLFDAVRRLGPAYHLVAIGGGRDYLAPPANVTLLPYLASRSRLARLLSGCDAFVHAGDKETFGLAVLEAMACGLPVVGMAAGGVAELVPADCGVLVEPLGGKAIATGIEALFQYDPKAMGSRARQYVVDHYSWDSVFRGLLAHYRALVTRQDSASDRPLRLAHDVR